MTPLSRAAASALRIVNVPHTIRCVPAPAFLTLPPRPAKPRSFGITHVLDKGMPAVMAEGLLRSAGDVIDIWKFGWGTAYLDPELDLKITLLRRHRVQPCLGGTLLEVAWLQGRAKDCLSWAAEAGIGMAEISRGVAPMTPAEKAELIAYAAQELVAVSEVGSKDPACSVVAAEWRDEVARDLDAGSWKVVAEGRESGTVGLYDPSGRVRVDVADAIASVDGAGRILFEAPKKDQQSWLIRHFGVDVNLANVAYEDVLGVEALRLGLRADTVGAYAPGKT
jgi:phosphosulfolactate synthase